MAKIKKFGTFGGVFTPSILTILGVIMYLRFPTIIGQAGLINTIGIIVIAHIISITTSLSVASLSTDKTVKNGGTYFMISRSLGLPIGGTLGLALFVGLSFSVSLYLIGFAESFLAYWGFDSSINAVRITGTIILILVTTITFISTSLAIKSQYFIMAAIVLSLLSIFFGHHEFTPEKVNWAPMADAAPFMLLFGIFFPAVTGFEAGVSMSGDLKDPKRSLPIGALSAVVVGFVVYIGLAFFYAYTVDANALRNDSDILFKIALVPSLVIAGIWGATLSSALGSILGAPRILQAIAMDNIAPKFFAKGTGKTNEPRNALLLAFIIAEAGILIGQLDVIARIVSMFFITTYAFLNLASAIESWSSSDFRPAFKIPKFVSILGAASAFIVMILLDFIALAGAVIVLGLLFFYLTRKELVLETGDAWSSFWTNLAKRSLLKLNTEKTNKRNWRPNIILFSGGEQVRPHLVELGLAMSGKLGALTDFELVLNDKVVKQKIESNTKPISNKEQDFFRRKFECNTLESGIKMVTSIYGFSGFEPNTIMMGWSRNPKNAAFLADVVTDFKQKKLNAVFLDYDKEFGFGKKENIDIWWNGKGRTLSFALNLIRFINADPYWRDANIRILIINSDNLITDKLYRNTKALLEERRIVAEVKIIPDDFGLRSKEMIIDAESAQADLIVLGLSSKTTNYTEEYINSISKISELPASLLVLCVSEEFEEINLVDADTKNTTIVMEDVVSEQLLPLPQITHPILKMRIEKLDKEIIEFTSVFIDNAIKNGIIAQIESVNLLKEYALTNLKNLEKTLNEETFVQLPKTIKNLHQGFLNFSINYFDEQTPQAFIETRELLLEGLNSLQTKIGNYIFEASETIIIPLKNTKNAEKNINLPYQKLIGTSLNSVLLPKVGSQLVEFENTTAKIVVRLKAVILYINDVYDKWRLNEKDDNLNLQNDKQKIKTEFEGIEQLLKNCIVKIKSELLNTVRNETLTILDIFLSPKVKKLLRAKIKTKADNNTDMLDTFPIDWENSMLILNNALLLDCHIFSEQKIISGIIQKNNHRINTSITEHIVQPIDKLVKNIDTIIKDRTVELKPTEFVEHYSVKELFQENYFKISEFIERLPESIELASNAFDETISARLSGFLVEVRVAPVKIARYYFDTRFYEPFYRELEQLDFMVKQAIVECKEANSLLKFRLDNPLSNSENYLHYEVELSSFLELIKKQVEGERNKISHALKQISIKADEMIKNAVAPLYSHTIIEAEKKISMLLREQKSKKINLGFSEKFKTFNEKINSLIVDVLYSSSDGLILAKNYMKKIAVERTSSDQILDLAKKVMPNTKVFSKIPVFYRTLFSSKSMINDDFWIPMDQEIKIIKNAIQRHKEGYGGAVLLTGVHGAGKTTLSRYIASHLFKKDRIYYIQAPVGGTAQLNDWYLAIQNTFSSKKKSIEIFKNIPPNSVVVINDLELWWERTKEGYVIIEEIIDLIRTYGQKTFFIANCNTYAFKQINKVFPIEDYFLSVVECKAFDTKKLQQLIQSRHKSSGLTLNYHNRNEDALSPIRLASLFNAYFSYSQGIPGVALNAWLNNIAGINNEEIFVSKPNTPNVDCLNAIDKDWLVIVSLFVQHKQMNANKLAKILDDDIIEIENVVNKLANAGIIVLKEDNVYLLSKYLEPFLVNICIEQGII